MPPKDESQLDASGSSHSVRQTYQQRGWAAAILEAAYKFGVYATVMAVLIGASLLLIKHLLDRDSNRETWIQTKFTGIIERDIESRRDVTESLKDFNKTAEDLSEAIEDFTKTQPTPQPARP